MRPNTHARLLSPWDQFPILAVIALIFIYMDNKGEVPPIAILGSIQVGGYMSAENLWHEAIIIGGFAWALLWFFCASLSVFAKNEAESVLSMLEPIRGLIPTGIMAIFFGLMASLAKGRIWIYVGFGLAAICVLAALFVSLKRLPYLSSIDGPNPDCHADGKWYSDFFYVSRTDSRILVPRRGGSGLALNLAHPRAWGILIAGLALFGLAMLASFGGLF
ncbi:MAG: DUF5808 domain-containing protein [Holophagaceae bacterium]|nr:DUF5808 domain-containing protein [Holophagaceae bacterium]